MKYRLLFILTIVAVTIGCILYACKKLDITTNAIYLTGAQTAPVMNVTIDTSGGTASIGVGASTIVTEDIIVDLNVSADLLAAYNKTNGTNYTLLPSAYYSLSALSTTIKSGTSANSVTVSISPLADTLSEGSTFAIPVTIANVKGNLPVLKASQTVIIVVNRVIVASAIDFSDGNYITFSMPKPLNAVSAFSVEFRVKMNSFANNMALFEAYPSEVYSRFGDVVIQPNQLQVKLAGLQPSSVTQFATNTWYNIAYVFDGVGNSFTVYVNGALDATSSMPPNTTFNWSTMQFCTGATPFLDGTANEVRLWTKALTQTEIQNGLCAVDPASPNLEGYWKMNEGNGNTVTDYSGHGHTGTPAKPITWVQGVSCP